MCLEGHFHSSNSESEEGNWDFTGCLSHPVVGAVGSQQESSVVLIGNSKLRMRTLTAGSVFLCWPCDELAICPREPG